MQLAPEEETLWVVCAAAVLLGDLPPVWGAAWAGRPEGIVAMDLMMDPGTHEAWRK